MDAARDYPGESPKCHPFGRVTMKAAAVALPILMVAPMLVAPKGESSRQG